MVMLTVFAWFVWLVVVGASIAVGLAFLLFALATPDIAIAKAIESLRITVTAAGLGIPGILSLGFMLSSRFGLGLLFAVLMLPFAGLLAYVFGM